MNDKDKITINLLKEQQKFINDNQHLIIEDNHQNLFLDNQEDIFPSLSTIFALLMAFLCVVGTITNTLSLIIFAKASSRRRSINVLLCGLSASDLCLCILALPVFSLAQLQHLIPGLQPSLANHLLVFCYPLCLMAQTMSVWMLVGITIDRWLAVCYPFSIRIHCTVKRARLIVLGTFLFSLFYNLVRFWEYRIDTNGEIVGLLRDDYLFMLLYQNLATTLSQFLLPLCVLCPLNLQVARAILAARERRKNMLWTELSSVEANSREQSTAAMMLVVVLACLPGNPKTCPLTCPPGCHCVVAGNSCCFPASSIQYNFWERIKNQPQQNSNNMGNLNNGNQLNNYLLMLLLLRQQQQGGGGLFNNNNGNYFGGCQDQAANCVSFSPLCFFSTKMLIFCPSTCGICQLNNPQFIQQRLLQILFGGQQQQGLNNNNFGQFGGGGGGNNNNLPSNGNQQQLSPYGSNTFGQIQSFLDNAQGIANQVSGVANSANTALGTIGGSGLNLQTLGQALGQRLGLG